MNRQHPKVLRIAMSASLLAALTLVAGCKTAPVKDTSPHAAVAQAEQIGPSACRLAWTTAARA